MKRALVVATATAVVAGMTGCAAARTNIAGPNPHIAIAADNPPSPATWPKYPHFSQHSCWGAPYPYPGRFFLTRFAPSYVPTPRAHPLAPQVVVHRLLARLGDRRFVRAIRLTPAPAAVGARLRNARRNARRHPPADALTARVVVREMNASHGNPSPERILRLQIAEYEAQIVGQALRDDFCDAGGVPLVVWRSDNRGGVANHEFALDQRFPNPSPAGFRKRVARIGRRFGFAVASLRLLRPRQIAPLLIVKTNRPRKAFVRDIPQIVELLNPAGDWPSHGSAATFEAFFFAVEDAKGPFASTQSLLRNENSSGGWGASRCLFPYGTGSGLGATGANGPTCS